MKEHWVHTCVLILLRVWDEGGESRSCTIPRHAVCGSIGSTSGDTTCNVCKQKGILMRQKWRPLVKSLVVLRGNQYTNFFFLKRIDIDRPFSCVKKNCISRGRHFYFLKRYFDEARNLTLYPLLIIIAIDQLYSS